MVSLSIIIPAYNSQETTVSLLESIAKSKKVDFNEIEVIVVDDASTDSTVNNILMFQSKTRSDLVRTRNDRKE